MTTDQADRVSRIVAVLASPVALRIILLVHEQGLLSVQQIYTQLKIEQSAASGKLIKLCNLGMLVRYDRGPATRYKLADSALDIIVNLATMSQEGRSLNALTNDTR